MKTGQHKDHRIKFNGGNPVCLDCDEYVGDPVQREVSVRNCCECDVLFAVDPRFPYQIRCVPCQVESDFA